VRRNLIIALSLAVVALSLALAACGGSDNDETTTTSPAPSAAPSEASPDPNVSALPPGFVECMADQGIDLEAEPDLSAAIHSPEGDRCFGELHGG
jgi:hypothetical protein